MDPRQTRNVLEACLLVTGRPMTVAQLEALFEDDIDPPDRKAIRESLLVLAESYEGRGIELVEVAGGWRLQTRTSMERWIGRLFQERPPRYSRALLETLVLIAYRQPITRGEIEEVRGVAVSSNIVRTLQERQWVREVGHKEVPGRPALLGTTSEFLDYFNLRRLDELPPLGELKDVDGIEAVLAAELGIVDDAGEAANDDGAKASTNPDLATDRNGDAEGAEEHPKEEGASTPLSLAAIAERFASGESPPAPDDDSPHDEADHAHAGDEDGQVGPLVETDLDYARAGDEGRQAEPLGEAGPDHSRESGGGASRMDISPGASTEPPHGPPSPLRSEAMQVGATSISEAGAGVDGEGEAAKTGAASSGQGSVDAMTAGSAPDGASAVRDGGENGVREPESGRRGMERPDPAETGVVVSADEPPERDDAQARMMRELDGFAEEHRRELDERAARERSVLSNPPMRDGTPARRDGSERTDRGPGGRPDDGSSRGSPPDGVP